MKLEELLASVPIDQWKVGWLYPLEWYDGPREGVCALAVPGGEFYFKLLAERYNAEGLDDRLYRLSELPAGSVAEVLSAARDFASADATLRERAEQRMEQVLSKKRPTALVIHTQDMEQFLGLWNVERPEVNGADWFSLLSIPVPATAETED
jgi:hypothetical protein